jgi:tellurite resistance protein
VTQELSASETETLVDALYAVFALVAGADGEVDEPERKRFMEMLGAAAQGPEPLHSVIVKALDHSDDRKAKAFASSEAAVDKVRAALRIADDRWDADAAGRFKHGLYKMGQAIAEASGGGFFGLRTRTSQTERDALAVLAACLGLD